MQHRELQPSPQGEQRGHALQIQIPPLEHLLLRYSLHSSLPLSGYYPVLIQSECAFCVCVSTGHFVSLVVLLLPLGHIVQLYLHVLTALLLYMGHQMSR